MEEQLLSDAGMGTTPIVALIAPMLAAWCVTSLLCLSGRPIRVVVAGGFITLLLAFGFATNANAETIPATQVGYITSPSDWAKQSLNTYASPYYSSVAAAQAGYGYASCNQTEVGRAKCYNSSGVWQTDLLKMCASGYATNITVNGSSYSDQTVCYKAGTAYECPDSSWTLEGTTCTRPDVCDATETGADRFVVGYVKKPSWDGVSTPDQVVDVTGAVCVTSSAGQQCQGALTSYVQGTALVHGSEPMYPVSGIFQWKLNGSECSGGEIEKSAGNEPPQPCPEGTAEGSVNGVVGCFAVSTATENTTTTTNPDGSVTTTKTTTSATGTTIETTTCTNGSCNTTVNHIGGGGSTGGPAGSGAGYDGDGGGSGSGGDGEGEERDPCGITGFPDCGVKVNEAGTPDGAGALDTAGDDMDAASDAFRDYLNNDVKKSGGDIGGIFTWSPQLPEGACAPRSFMGNAIDICQPLGMVRDLWAWAVVFMAGLYIWRSGTGAIGGGVK